MRRAPRVGLALAAALVIVIVIATGAAVVAALNRRDEGASAGEPSKATLPPRRKIQRLQIFSTVPALCETNSSVVPALMKLSMRA